jgi:hypothetical protein
MAGQRTYPHRQSHPGFISRMGNQGLAYSLSVAVFTRTQPYRNLVAKNETAASLCPARNQGAANRFKKNTGVSMS